MLLLTIGPTNYTSYTISKLIDLGRTFSTQSAVGFQFNRIVQGMMQQSSILVLLVAILASAGAIPAGTAVASDQISATIEAEKNVGVFTVGNQLPGQGGKVGQQLIYTLGQRVAGDRLVSTKSDSKQWPTAQDVTLSLAYPSSGVGAVVTYVQVTVKQSSNLGKGYVVAGGIGQRFIHLNIEAYSTTYMTYTVQIFGL